MSLAALAGCRTPMPPGAASRGLRVGPLFETASGDDGSRLLAIRPFYSLETSPQSNPAAMVVRREDDIVWPLGIRSRRDDHYYWRALLFYGTGTIDDPTSPNDPWRFRLFPFLYSGRTQEGDDYTALFPIGGTIRDFLVFHDVSFVLFPIYAEGRSANNTEMRTVLWPFYLTRHGERLDQFRLWPFYGTAERRDAATTRRSRFVVWPFWNDASSSGQVEGSGFVLFPIYAHSRYERRRRGVEESWGVIPPLFQYARGDDGFRRLYAPWPFVRLLDNDGLRERHIWPLWGRTERFLEETGDDGPPRPGYHRQMRSSAPTLTRQYFLWPFFSNTESELDGVRRTVSHLPLPFYFHREEYRLGSNADGKEQTMKATYDPTIQRSNGSTDQRTNGPTDQRTNVQTSSYTRLWPLFSWRRTAGAETRARVPELSLWSMSEQVERNWAPLWSLYTYRSKPDGAYCNDLLWGFLSWGRNADGGRILSVFWIPFAR